jgi:hypothetical protein
MTLTDLRKLTIRKQIQIRFRLRNGMECVITDKGIAKVPALQSRPDFNLDEELAAASEFLIDTVAPLGKKAEKPRTLRRDELAAMFDSAPSAAPAHDHDDE